MDKKSGTSLRATIGVVWLLKSSGWRWGVWWGHSIGERYVFMLFPQCHEVGYKAVGILTYESGRGDLSVSNSVAQFRLLVTNIILTSLTGVKSRCMEPLVHVTKIQPIQQFLTLLPNYLVLILVFYIIDCIPVRCVCRLPLNEGWGRLGYGVDWRMLDYVDDNAILEVFNCTECIVKFDQTSIMACCCKNLQRGDMPTWKQDKVFIDQNDNILGNQ